jgi:hypothetical protein
MMPGEMDLPDRFRALPGADLVEAGLSDLAASRMSEAAALVLIGAATLRRLGLPVPEGVAECPEHELYRLLHEQDQDSAHGRYNALVRRLVSFERAAECAA